MDSYFRANFPQFPQLDSQYTATAKVRHDQIRNESSSRRGIGQSLEPPVGRVGLGEDSNLLHDKGRLVRLGQGPALS